MRIYWIANGQRCGPASVPDMLAKLELGELSAETQGWHAGCEGWRPLRELPALAEHLERISKRSEAAAAPAAGQEEEEKPLPQQNSNKVLMKVMLPSPGTRFLARMIDVAIYSTILLGVMYALNVPYKGHFQPGSLFFWLPMVLIEAYILSRWGTTPGKSLLGIRVQHIKGRFSYGSALKRSALVFVLGTGCMVFPLLFLITLGVSYYGISRHGIAVWDIRSSTLPMVTFRPSVWKRLFAILFLIFSFHLCVEYMKPWLPDMIDELRARDPSAAQTLEEWISSKQ